MPFNEHATQWESDVSGIKSLVSGVTTYFDVTSINVFSGIQASTGSGGGITTKTGAIVDLSKYTKYMIYLDSSSVTATMAGPTGLQVSFYSRANSAAGSGRLCAAAARGRSRRRGFQRVPAHESARRRDGDFAAVWLMQEFSPDLCYYEMTFAASLLPRCTPLKITFWEELECLKIRSINSKLKSKPCTIHSSNKNWQA